MSNRTLLLAPASLLALQAGVVQIHAAQTEAFLKLDGITGESTDAQHKGWIALDSFSWGVSNSTSIGSASSGAGAGKVTFSTLQITKSIDKASPILLQACATGQHLKTATLEVVSYKATDLKGAATVLLHLELTEAGISQVVESGARNAPPSENVGLVFARVAIADGQPSPTQVPIDLTPPADWNIETTVK